LRCPCWYRSDWYKHRQIRKIPVMNRLIRVLPTWQWRKYRNREKKET